MPGLAELYQGEIVPSRAFVEGGIHEAIAEYENNVFFDILAEDLARRDMDDAPIDESNYAEPVSYTHLLPPDCFLRALPLRRTGGRVRLDHSTGLSLIHI